jgi:hypothetical protein
MKTLVYKNLKTGNWSLCEPKGNRSRGRVFGHSDEVWLRDVSFYVSESAHARVQVTHHREVHAWASGELCDAPGKLENGFAVTYHPYKAPKFFERATGVEITAARYVHFTSDRGAIAYL